MNRVVTVDEANARNTHVHQVKHYRSPDAVYRRNLKYAGEASISPALTGEIRGDISGGVHYYPAPVPTPEPEPFVIEADLEGYDLCPDPLKAQDVEEFVSLLAQYRLWAGSPSFREMERRCHRKAAASTFCKMLKKTAELPSQHLIRAFIRGCGGDDQAVQTWITAWRLQAGPVLSQPVGA
ncbi:MULTISPECIES: hypothetical protein [unclassified Nocardiopsis]|uniref:hypothetical protein n=1 Tax=unclassified Nocardiopsis TaxID=2649073 RepID=UPI000E3ED801|nr:hypothetical protein [Nocardiopsis sp. TNDT3]